VGGLKALVQDGQTGLMFDPNATEAAEQLAHGFMRLHAEPALATALGSAGRNEARANYDWKVIGARLESIYCAAEDNAARRYGRTKS
jgi:starch synthase